MIVEAVCCSVEDVLAAERAGARRVELCSAIELGGLTPSVGLIGQVIAHCKVPRVAMVRPRPGGFAYSDAEIAVMERDGASLVRRGLDGIVVAALTRESKVDVDACRRLLDAARIAKTQTADAVGLSERLGLAPRPERPLQLVFHRAFDATSDLFESMETLIELGFTRILTSGGAATALEGIDALSKLVEQAAGRIEILPAGGIRAANAREILARSGCSQLHLGPMREVADATAPFYGATHRALDEAALSAVVAASAL